MPTAPTLPRDRRPPLRNTLDDPSLGDDAYMLFETALRAARRRAIERGCRQQVHLSESGNYWVLQDVR